MGTGIDKPGKSGGDWTDYKRTASNFATYGGSDRAQKTLAALVAVLGGAAAAVASSPAATTAGQTLGAFAAGAAEGGLDGGLAAVGLEDLVGGSRFEVLNALIDRIAGTGETEEAVAARSAVLDVLAELIPDTDDPDEVGEVRLGPEEVRDAILRFLARYVYNRVGEILEQRLARLEDDALIQTRDREMRAYIDSLVRLRLRDLDPLSVDWSAGEGRRVIESILESTFALAQAEDE
jgi:hypothetical protein